MSALSNTYFDRVAAQKQRNPCLSDLCEFLQQPARARDQSRIVCLDIFEHPRPPTEREIVAQDFDAELRSPNRQAGLLGSGYKGRLLIIEDVSKGIVEQLGAFFNIDPLFFASYVHQTWRKTSTQSPATCSLPSRDRKQGFLSLQYHRTVSFQQKDTQLRSITRNSNQQRKAVILPSLGGKRIGLVQHCCAVLLTDSPGEEWTGIVLVDPPIENDYIPSQRHGQLPPNLDSKPFLDGCEDFTDTPMPKAGQTRPTPVSDRGMLDELVHYWTQQQPPMFSPSVPTIQALSYYPLKVVAAEWVNYIAVLGLSLREYELSTSMAGDLVAELDELNTNLRILQGWRRRILSTQAKMRRTACFIRNHADPRKPNDDWDALREDYDFISTEVSEYGKRLEAMVPLVTSAAALIESRRSLTETANVTRLTILAIIFIPLSYVAALFSMAENFGPTGSLFWVYFATAIPLAGVVGVVAKPPVGFAREVWNRVRMSGAVKIFE